MNRQTIALFDFDGTLCVRDSFRPFVSWVDPEGRGWRRFAQKVPGVLLKSGFDRNAIKKALIRSIFEGYTEHELMDLARQFTAEQLPKLYNPAVFSRMRQLQDAGAQVAVVSASLDIWLKPFAEVEGVELLCTEADYDHGVFRGEWRTPNCRGAEKPRRILEKYPNARTFHLVAYGNSLADKPMLNLAHEAWWVEGSGALRQYRKR